MATKVTQYDDVGEGRGASAALGDGVDLADESGEGSVSGGRLVETPTSGGSRSTGKIGGNGDDEGVGVESDFEVPEEGVPLKRLPRPKAKKEKGRTRVKSGDGAVDTDEPHTDDELVVRWSQDGGSPTSFRKLREQHKGRRGSHSTTGAKKEKRRRRGLEEVGIEEEENGGDMEEFEGPLVGRGERGIFYTKEEERRVRRKMDKWLVGFLAGLYMLSFLDRSSELPRSFLNGFRWGMAWRVCCVLL